MNVYTLTPTGFGSNCYVVTSGNGAIVIDPSVASEKILAFVKQKGAVLEAIVLTHGHFDHVTSLDELRELTQAPALIHKADAEMLCDGEKNAHALFFGIDKKWKPAEKLLDDGDRIALGDEAIEVISTPGHSKGSICLNCGDFMITGDTIFANGFGRYDLHGGDARQLRASLEALRKFDRNLTIYPGHGDSARLGDALDNVLYYF